MAPNTKIEFVVIRITFGAHIHPQYPKIHLTKRKSSPNSTISQVREWFDRVYEKERSHLPAMSAIRFTEWKIMSGNSNIFFNGGWKYDNILLFLGEESNYWTFYQTFPPFRRIEGSGMLPCSYCGCCINEQYLKILEVVKEHKG